MCFARLKVAFATLILERRCSQQLRHGGGGGGDAGGRQGTPPRVNPTAGEERANYVRNGNCDTKAGAGETEAKE